MSPQHALRAWLCAIVLPVLLSGARASFAACAATCPECLSAARRLQDVLDELLDQHGTVNAHVDAAYLDRLKLETERLMQTRTDVLSALSCLLIAEQPKEQEEDDLRDYQRRLRECTEAEGIRRKGVDTLKIVQKCDKEVSREQARGLNKCVIADLLAMAGRNGPAKVAELLIGALPTDERAFDWCVVNNLRFLGPEIDEVLVTHVLKDRDLSGAYYSAVALLVRVSNTEFWKLARLGDTRRWKEEFPVDRRKVRRLVRQWQGWWEEHGGEFQWNADTGLYEPKAGTCGG